MAGTAAPRITASAVVVGASSASIAPSGPKPLPPSGVPSAGAPALHQAPTLSGSATASGAGVSGAVTGSALSVVSLPPGSVLPSETRDASGVLPGIGAVNSVAVAVGDPASGGGAPPVGVVSERVTLGVVQEEQGDQGQSGISIGAKRRRNQREDADESQETNNGGNQDARGPASSQRLLLRARPVGAKRIVRTRGAPARNEVPDPNASGGAGSSSGEARGPTAGSDLAGQNLASGTGAKGGAGGAGGAVRPRVPGNKAAWDRERAEMGKEIAVLSVRLEAAQTRLAEREREIVKLEKLLAEERVESKRLYQNATSRDQSMVDGLTTVMVKSHHSAMQTLQSTAHAMQINLAQSMTRLRERGARVKMLMPPTPVPADQARPEALAQFNQQIAEYLKRRVPDVARGQALQEEIDRAIAESEATLAEERRRLADTGTNTSTSTNTNPPLAAHERATLAAVVSEQENQLRGLRLERAMLVEGLERWRRTHPTPLPTVPSTAPSVLPAAPVSGPNPVVAPPLSGATGAAN